MTALVSQITRSWKSLSLLVSCLGLIFLVGCSTGESSLKTGDYTEAALVSAERLSRQPNHKKATQVFLAAYPKARSFWLARVQAAESDLADPFRWERVNEAYHNLQNLSDRAALTPWAGDRLIVLGDYFEAIESSRISAGEARVVAGKEKLDTGDLFLSREAHQHFRIAKRFAPERAELTELLEQARYQGTLRVGIDPVRSGGHGIGPLDLEAELAHVLGESDGFRFVEFAPTSQWAEGQVHHYLEVSIGELALERVEKEVETRSFSREVPSRKEGTEPRLVSAKVVTREKALIGTCPVYLQVFSSNGEERLFERELDGRSVWKAQWDVVLGDERAVEGVDLHLSEPPDPEFGELAENVAHEIALAARRSLSALY